MKRQIVITEEECDEVISCIDNIDADAGSIFNRIYEKDNEYHIEKNLKFIDNSLAKLRNIFKE